MSLFEASQLKMRAPELSDRSQRAQGKHFNVIII